MIGGPESPEKPRNTRSRRPRRFSTHKARAAWFQERATYPFRDANVWPVAECRCYEHPDAYLWTPPDRAKWKWEELGPSNIGGRLTSLIVDAADERRLIAGAAAGGVWRSVDAGATWELFWNDPRTLNIGSLASHKDAAGGGFLLCGTGEANLSTDNYPGVGVFRHEPPEDGWRWIAPASAGLPLRIGALAINPRNPAHVLLGGVTHLADELGGLYRSTDGGFHWQRQLNGDRPFITARSFHCHAVVFHPKETCVLAAVDANGPLSGIWRSTDDGITWAQCSRGLPPGEEFGRASLAFAGSARRVYAFAENGRDSYLGFYRSDDLGESWMESGSHRFVDERQLSYNNCIAAHPEDHDVVICGGVELHRTRDGGRRWRQITDSGLRRGSKRSVHEDHHALAITRGGAVYSANDGGLDISLDLGESWENRSRGLRITMFYDLDVAPSNGGCYGGGAQDNGTVLRLPGARKGEFSRELDGDGGWMVYDPDDEELIIASAQRMSLRRHTRRFGWEDITPENASNAERNRVWMSFIAMDRTPDAMLPRRLFAGTTRVWRSIDGGTAWRPVSNPLDGSPVSAIEVAPLSPDCVLVGTERGGIFRGTRGGTRWSPNVAGPELPRKIVTRIAGHPRDPSTFLATVGGVARPVRPVENPYRLYDAAKPPDTGQGDWPRVFISRDEGRTWSGAYEGCKLPGVPHHAVVFDPARPDCVFVSNDAGVFMSDNLGAAWSDISGELPPVMVTDLVIHADDAGRFLYAATYGRGIWRIRLEP